jgi:diaminohydroxyphosphoribosylaminopyrimidine deaminase/5-amino-6-(5-phosphoribosylamino)uracil reductase
MESSDEKFIQIALNLAKRGVGITAPNPSVGCVIVKDGQIIATGVTSKGGRPHAEFTALQKAGDAAKGATAYVTLEPCSHHGKTPPCADILIKAGIAKVVIATKDTYKKVSGSGIKRLKDADIDVVEDVCQERARQINEGFFSVQERGRPYITLKLATSINSKIADKDGNSKWITGEDTRRYAHYLRAKNDAILIGSGTAIKDDPMLNCRLPGMEEQSPIRVILDNDLKTPIDSNLVKTANAIPTYIFCSAGANNKKLTESGVFVHSCTSNVKLSEVLEVLTAKGVTRLLVEGGSKVAASFLSEGFVDEIIWMRAPKSIPDDGIDAILGLDIENISTMNFSKISQYKIIDDVVTTYKLSKTNNLIKK